MSEPVLSDITIEPKQVEESKKSEDALTGEDVEMGDDDDTSKYESYKDTPLAKLKSWEKLVKKVNTVENNNDQLIVYFETLASLQLYLFG